MNDYMLASVLVGIVAYPVSILLLIVAYGESKERASKIATVTCVLYLVVLFTVFGVYSFVKGLMA